MTNIYDNAKNEIELDVIYAFISKDADGEGIISRMMLGMNMPMVFGHPRLLKPAKKLAAQIAFESGKKIRLVKYTKTEVMEEW